MNDYIKRDVAIMTAMDYNGCGNAQDASQDIAAELASIPAADVRENVRGRWICDNLIEKFITCSICKETYKRRQMFNYCPNCGADMRGAKDV